MYRREIVSIDAAASLRLAAMLMRSHHVGALVVTVDKGGQEQAVGIVTDRDLTIEVLAAWLARRRLVSVPASAGVAEAVEVMRRPGARRLLVTGGQSELVGFVSADDLLEALAAAINGLAQTMRSGIARKTAERTFVPPPRPVFLPYGTAGMQQPITAL